MNKSEFVSALSEKLQITQKDASAIVEAVFDTNGGIITTALEKHDYVMLSGFGVFEIQKRTARTARNPKTGKQVLVPEKRMPVFKPGKALKEKFNRVKK